MMPRLDLTGKTYGRLTVLRPAGKDKHGQSLWGCACSCGDTTVVPVQLLRSGQTRSCGCLRRETARLTAVRQRKCDRAELARYRAKGFTCKALARMFKMSCKRVELILRRINQ